MLRIHADGSSDAATHGTHTLRPALRRGWTDDVHAASRRAALLVQRRLVARLGSRDLGIQERSDLTGFNWADVPVVLVELGFLSNPREDRLLATAAYRARAASGLRDGVLAFLAPVKVVAAAARTFRLYAIALAVAAVIIVAAFVDDGAPDDERRVARPGASSPPSWQPPAVLVSLFAAALGALAAFPERVRAAPGDATQHGVDAQRLFARRGFGSLLLLPFRLLRLGAGTRETFMPYAPLLPLVSVPFLVAAGSPRSRAARAPARGRRARRPRALGRDPGELRDDVAPVRPQRLLLPLGHEVDVELVDADRLELLQLRRDLLRVAEHREAVGDLVRDEVAVLRADARVLVVVVELPLERRSR